MTITGSKLRRGSLDSGPNALTPRLLDLLEFDGYIWLDDTSTTVRQRQAAPPAVARAAAPVGEHHGDAVAAVAITTIATTAALRRPAGRDADAQERRHRRGRGRHLLAGRDEPEPAERPARDEHADHRPASPSACRRSRSRPTSARRTSRSSTSSPSTRGSGTAPSVPCPASTTSSWTRTRTARPTSSSSRRPAAPTDISQLVVLVRPERSRRRADRRSSTPTTAPTTRTRSWPSAASRSG